MVKNNGINKQDRGFNGVFNTDIQSLTKFI